MPCIQWISRHLMLYHTLFLHQIKDTIRYWYDSTVIISLYFSGSLGFWEIATSYFVIFTLYICAGLIICFHSKLEVVFYNMYFSSSIFALIENYYIGILRIWTAIINWFQFLRVVFSSWLKDFLLFVTGAVGLWMFWAEISLHITVIQSQYSAVTCLLPQKIVNCSILGIQVLLQEPGLSIITILILSGSSLHTVSTSRVNVCFKNV